MVFASAAARTSAIASPQEGMISFLKDTNSTEYYSGSAWVAIGGSTSPLTTKGDLYTYSTANARLGVGTNGQVLVADSAESTGLKWSTPATTSFPTFAAYKSGSTQSLTNDVYTKITFATETWDTNSNYDTSTSRFTPTVAGYYQINVTIDMGVGASSYMQAYIYKNGTIDQPISAVWGVTEMYLSGSAIVNFNGSSDYVEVYARGGSSPAVYTGSTASKFQAIGIRS
jgi:hypothetical protein